jgi:hypothetical protein
LVFNRKSIAMNEMKERAKAKAKAKAKVEAAGKQLTDAELDGVTAGSAGNFGVGMGVKVEDEDQSDRR